VLIRIPGVNTTTKKNKRTGQVKRYYYHRQTGERLPDDPTSMEFLVAKARLDARPIGEAPAERTFKHLVEEYKKSEDFLELAPSTKSEYLRHIKYLEPVLGSFLVRGLRPGHVAKLKQKYAATPTLAKAIGRGEMSARSSRRRARCRAASASASASRPGSAWRPWSAARSALPPRRSRRRRTRSSATLSASR